MDLAKLEGFLSTPLVEDEVFNVKYYYIRENKDLDPLLEYLMARPAQSFDTETTGLNVAEDKIILAQVGDENRQFLLDPRYTDLETLKPWFESSKHKKVGHNLLYDYCMLSSDYGIQMEASRCTFLAEMTLTMGSQYGGRSLYAVTKKYLQKELDKAMQTSFIGHQGDFSEAQLAYAAADVRDPIKILQLQSKELLTTNLAPTFVLECDALPAFGDMRVGGMLLDRELWDKTLANNRQKVVESREKMDEIADSYVSRNLFGELSINYDSPDQVLELLKMMNVQVDVWQKETRTWVKKPIQNTNKQTQKKIMHLPFIKAMSDYRKYAKLINTYGENFYPCISEKTGRLHPELKQMGTETGRPSAGEESEGDDLFSAKKHSTKSHSLPNINPLNIPGRPEYRHAFIAKPDYVIETDDYSGCEMRILAEISMDPKLIGIFDRKEDAHCFVASELYGVEVTKDNEHGALRKPAKALNFGIAYGLGVTKLFEDLNAEGFHITIDEAQEKYNKYCHDIFPVAVKYLRDIGKLASEQGFLTNLNGRRRYWNLPNPDDLERFPRGKFDDVYKGTIAKIQREGGNFSIQSVNADITKRAMADIRKFAKEHGIRTMIYNAVYDEIVTETHKDDHAFFWPHKQRIMREAAQIWLKRVPMEVDGHALPYWTK